jgi:hypothetical protein
MLQCRFDVQGSVRRSLHCDPLHRSSIEGGRAGRTAHDRPDKLWAAKSITAIDKRLNRMFLGSVEEHIDKQLRRRVARTQPREPDGRDVGIRPARVDKPRLEFRREIDRLKPPHRCPGADSIAQGLSLLRLLPFRTTRDREWRRSSTTPQTTQPVNNHPLSCQANAQLQSRRARSLDSNPEKPTRLAAYPSFARSPTSSETSPEQQLPRRATRHRSRWLEPREF